MVKDLFLEMLENISITHLSLRDQTIMVSGGIFFVVEFVPIFALKILR